jgi:5-methyltetrahydropteroyltriglutamate--homocysteine methyltransferase
MKTSQDRILTTHVGSLPRTQAVLEILERHETRADATEPAFDPVVQQAVLDNVRRQLDVGIDIVSDGEASKISYATYVKDRLTGLSEGGATEAARPHLDLAPFPDYRQKMALLSGKRRFKRVSCIGPVAARPTGALEQDLQNMRRAVTVLEPTEAFLNAASPGVVASFLPNEYYPSHHAYVEAIADAMRAEYEAIAAAGFILQVDCPDLAMSRHATFQDLSETEFLDLARFHVEALNHALANVPADRIRMHVCWGNYEGPHNHDIDFFKIVRIILDAKPMGISLEAANPRHEHEWTIWSEIPLPDNKVLIPGLIDTSTNYVEHPELIAQRIVRLARIIGRERVIAGTDCGFGTSAGYGKIDPEIAFLKLRALSQGAARASEILY